MKTITKTATVLFTAMLVVSAFGSCGTTTTENATSSGGISSNQSNTTARTEQTTQAIIPDNQYFNYTKDDLEYDYDTETEGIIIKAARYYDSEYLALPDEIDGIPVTIIGKSVFEDNKYVKGVKLPKDLKEIREKAFCGCLATIHNLRTS